MLDARLSAVLVDFSAAAPSPVRPRDLDALLRFHPRLFQTVFSERYRCVRARACVL